MMIHRGISGAMCMPLFDPCNHVAVCFHMLSDDGDEKRLGDLKFKAWSLKCHLSLMSLPKDWHLVFFF